MGSGTGIVYMEDNRFSGPAGCIDWADGNWGARIAARFNSIDSPQCYFETHGTGQTGANNRGFHWLELYGNSHVNSTQFFGLAFIRGGTGMIWGNRINAGAQDFVLNNNRSTASDAPLCDGTQIRDQNTPGQSGWHCQDQIGTLRDATLYSAGSAWNQVLQPYYMWKNYIGAGTTKYQPFVHNTPAAHVSQNRDYYLENSAFTGVTGVGMGTLAARPGTCTTGVGYWATDQGSWNTSSSNPYGEQMNGSDGVLYTCTSTNTWTLLYTPYTYPHPLQTGGGGGVGDTTPPTNPSSLLVTAVSSSQLNVSWTGSTDNVAVTAYLVERCQGNVCTNFVQITSTLSTSLIDTGLLASTRYRYRVRATDAAGNLSGYSNVLGATTFAVDATAPSVPSNLLATAISKTRIDLTWTASTDNVAVSGYQVFRCLGGTCSATVQIGTPAANAYSDTTASCSTVYTYRVTAVDTSGNVSAYSLPSSATTLGCTTAPSAPTGFTLQPVSDYSRDTTSWSWTQGAGTAADGFHVSCGLTAGSRTVIYTLNSTGTTTVLLRQFLPGQGLWFCTVTAFNAGGDSSEATEVSTNVIGPGFGAWGFAY